MTHKVIRKLLRMQLRVSDNFNLLIRIFFQFSTVKNGNLIKYILPRRKSIRLGTHAFFVALIGKTLSLTQNTSSSKDFQPISHLRSVLSFALSHFSSSIYPFLFTCQFFLSMTQGCFCNNAVHGHVTGAWSRLRKSIRKRSKKGDLQCDSRPLNA